MSITGVMLDDINGGSLGLLANGSTQTLPDALAQELINRGMFRRASSLPANSAPLQALLDPDTGLPSGVGVNGDKTAGAAAVAAAVGTGTVRADMPTIAAAAASAPNQITLAPYDPTKGPYAWEPDLLFGPRANSHLDVIEEGGRLNPNYLGYWAANKAPLVAAASTKWGLAAGFDQFSASGGLPMWQADGILPADGFILTFWLTSVGADYTAQPTGASFFRYSNNSTNQDQFHIQNPGSTILRATFETKSAATPYANFCDVTLAAGDIPADTPTPITVVYNPNATGTSTTPQLQMFIGNGGGTTGNKYGKRDNLSDNKLYTDCTNGVDENSGYMSVLATNAGGASGAWRISEAPRVYRYPDRITKQADIGALTVRKPAPTITIDASTVTGTFNQKLLGVAASYKGFAFTLPDGDTVGRAATIAKMYEAGARTTRCQILLNKVTITGTYPNYVYDWSEMISELDALNGFGIYLSIGGCPGIFNSGTPSLNAVPSSNSGYAQMVSDFISLCRLRNYNILGINFYNEPSGSGFWGGTAGQLTTLWLAVAQKVQTDWPVASYPQYVIDAPDDNYGQFDGNRAFQKIIDSANTNGLPLRSAGLHHYTGNLGDVWRFCAGGDLTATKSIYSYLNSKGFSAAKVRLTEWGYDHSVSTSLAGAAANQMQAFSHASDPFNTGVQAAAYTGAMIARLPSIANLEMAALYTMQQTDPGYGTSYPLSSGETAWGLLTIEGRPRPALPVMWMAWRAGCTKNAAPSQISVSSNWPTAKAWGTKDANGAIRVFYSSWRRWRRGDAMNYCLQWSGLPAAFTWRHWQFDHSKLGDTRPTLVASGDASNLPIGIQTTMSGVGLIEIVPN